MSNPKLPPVKLKSRFYEILGEKREDMPDDQRRQRWEKWKNLAHAAGRGAGVRYWTAVTQSCSSCRHRDQDWCTLAQLPCTVNPTLTFTTGYIGMACQGAGYEPKDPELLTEANPEP